MKALVFGLVLGLLVGAALEVQANRGFYEIKVNGTKCITNGDNALSCDFR